MKKVGLITFHKYHNYGAVLQAYATMNYINESCKDVECEIIDYYEPHLIDVCAFTPHRLYGDIQVDDEYSATRKLYADDIQERKLMFQKFQDEYYHLSEAYCSRIELIDNSPKYDVYITGSDQVWNWNREYTTNRLLPYLLWFTHSPNKIAFGSGMGGDIVEDIYIPFKYRPAICAYKKIMLREHAAVERIKKVTKREDIEWVLDPIFLKNEDEYRAIVGERLNKEAYIFAYVFDYDYKMYMDIVETLKVVSETEEKTVILINNTIPINCGNVKTVINAGPLEWLNYLIYADLVITNSFHGLAFSLNCCKDAWIYGMDTRKKPLLDMFLTDSLNEELVIKFKKENIDINKLYELKERTRRLLCDAIKGCE